MISRLSAQWRLYADCADVASGRVGVKVGMAAIICMVPTKLARACEPCSQSALEIVYREGFASILHVLGLPLILVLMVACVILWPWPDRKGPGDRN